MSEQSDLWVFATTYAHEKERERRKTHYSGFIVAERRGGREDGDGDLESFGFRDVDADSGTDEAAAQKRSRWRWRWRWRDRETEQNRETEQKRREEREPSIFFLNWPSIFSKLQK